MAAEDAAVDVRLVEHHEAQVVQVLGPALVAGEDADVEHVGVAEQDRGRAPQQGARVLRRVAVVDRRDGRLDARRVEPERAQLARLVLGQRLGGEEEERAALRVARVVVEHGQLVAEALAAGGAGADHHVLAGPQGVVGGALVAVQALDAGREERFAQRGRQVRGQLRRAAPARGLVRHGHDLLVAALAEQGAQALLDGGVTHAAILLDGPAPTTAPRGGPAGQGGSARARRCAVRCTRTSEGAPSAPLHQEVIACSRGATWCAVRGRA